MAFVYADYVAKDFTVLAGLSGDLRLQALLGSGRDFYTALANEVFGIPEDEVSPEVRRVIKVLGLAVSYGKTVWTVARELEIAYDEAADLQAALLDAFPVARDFLSEAASSAVGTRESRTPLGRRRVYPAGTRKDVLERQARNFAVQAHGADLFKERLVVLHQFLQANKLGHVVLTMHDGFLLAVFEGRIPDAVPEIRRILERSPLLASPLRVKIGTGSTWAEAEDR
jgi:DNA polymerase-1